MERMDGTVQARPGQARESKARMDETRQETEEKKIDVIKIK